MSPGFWIPCISSSSTSRSYVPPLRIPKCYSFLTKNIDQIRQIWGSVEMIALLNEETPNQHIGSMTRPPNDLTVLLSPYQDVDDSASRRGLQPAGASDLIGEPARIVVHLRPAIASLLRVRAEWLDLGGQLRSARGVLQDRAQVAGRRADVEPPPDHALDHDASLPLQILHPLGVVELTALVALPAVAQRTVDLGRIQVPPDGDVAARLGARGRLLHNAGDVQPSAASATTP